MQEAYAAVAAEKLRASRVYETTREILPAQQYGVHPALETALQQYVLAQFAVFAREAFKLGHAGIWPVDLIDSAAGEMLRRTKVEAIYEKGFDSADREFGRNWLERGSGDLTGEMSRQFRRSAEWREFEKHMLMVAEHQSGGVPVEINQGHDREADLFDRVFEEIKKLSDLAIGQIQQTLKCPPFLVRYHDLINTISTIQRVAPSAVTSKQINDALLLLSRKHPGGVCLDPVSTSAAGAELETICDDIRDMHTSGPRPTGKHPEQMSNALLSFLETEESSTENTRGEVDVEDRPDDSGGNESDRSGELPRSKATDKLNEIASAKIDKLRRECGWSFDTLAEKTGLDKKLILGHVSAGNGMWVRTRKVYADAFTKELKRLISVAEIEP